MNQDRQLKIQAFLDGELSSRETRQVEQWLATDREAQVLLNELKATQSLLRANEPALSVPDTREFYWSQIERRIDQPVREAARLPFWLMWRRYVAPFGAVAVVALLAVFSMKFYDVGLEDRHLAEIENLSEHASSLSFRSQSENMFVVWVYNKDQQSEGADDSIDDAVIQ